MHEIGHALGLDDGDACDGGDNTRPSIMRGKLTSSEAKDAQIYSGHCDLADFHMCDLVPHSLCGPDPTQPPPPPPPPPPGGGGGGDIADIDVCEELPVLCDDDIPWPAGADWLGVGIVVCQVYDGPNWQTIVCPLAPGTGEPPPEGGWWVPHPGGVGPYVDLALAEGAVVSGAVPITGIASTSMWGVREIAFWIDGVPVDLGGFQYGLPAAASCYHPATGLYDPNCPNIGFAGTLDTTAYQDGPHTLKLVAIDRRLPYPLYTVVERDFVVSNAPPPAPPDLRVVLAGAGTEIPHGGSYGFGTFATGDLPIIRNFLACNDGGTSLQIQSVTVTGTGFTKHSTGPAANIAAGACSNFWVKFNGPTAGQSYSGSVALDSNDPDEDPYTFAVGATLLPPPPSPDLVVREVVGGVETTTVVPNGSLINLGSVAPTIGLSRVLSLRNFGTANLVLTNPAHSGTCYWRNGPSPLVIPPGGGVWVNVVFHCTEPPPPYGPYAGSFSVGSNDPADNPLTLNFTASLVPNPNPRLWVKQLVGGLPGPAIFPNNQIVFPTTSVGVPVSVRFQVTNIGGANLTLSNPTSLVSGMCFTQIETPAAVVPPGGVTHFRIRLHCATPGTYDATVTVRSNDPARPGPGTLTFTVRGNVTYP